MSHWIIRGLLLLLFALPSLTHACVFTWTNPTTYTDNTPLMDLGGTYLWYQAQGSTTGVQVADIPAPATTTTVPGACQTGTYWATAYTTLGIESDVSNLVLVKKPNQPVVTNMRK